KPDADLYLDVVAKADGREVKLTERLALLKSMYVTHLATDKPMYQPGQKVYFRSLTLQRFNFKPPTEEFRLVYTITSPQGQEVFKHEGARLADEKGKEILGPDNKPVRGIGAGEWEIPAGQPGGEYTLAVSDAHHRFPPEKRKFLINEYRPPRLNKELDFTRNSYGPGDDVVA